MGTRFKVGVAILSAAVAAVSQSLNAFNVKPDFQWAWVTLIAMAIFIGLVFWGWSEAARQLRQIKERQPRLKLHHTELEKKINRVIINNNGSQTILGNPHFARIWISNEPEKPELGVDAKNVYAEIQFFDKSKQPVLRINGRWPEAGQPAGSLATQQMTLPPNRKPFCLDIAMKYVSDQDMYGYDDLAQLMPDGRNVNTKLGTGVFFIRVILACEGSNENLWLELENPGKGLELSFKRLTHAQSTKLASHIIS